MFQVTDTPPTIEQALRRQIMARSGEERFIMSAEMFESAREMVMEFLQKDLSEANGNGCYSNASMERRIGRYGSDAG
jgi:hypothetical protein